MRIRLVVALASMTAMAASMACGTSDESTEKYGATSAELISDSAHGGRTGFTFLPPIAPRPQVLGENLTNLSPIVEIDSIDANGNITGVVETFRRGDANKLLRVHLKTDPVPDGDGDGDMEQDGYYVARWRTALDHVVAGSSYRARVLLGANQLGFADIRVVASDKEAKKIDATQYVAVVAGNVLRVKFDILPSALACKPSFAAPIAFATSGSSPTQLAVGDLNHDAKTDLAWADYFDGTEAALDSTTTGGAISFTKTGIAPGDSNALSVALGDVDRDGKVDAVEANYYLGLVLNRGNGDGTFGAATILDGAPLVSASLADVDGNGTLDALICRAGGLDVELQSTGGTFAPPVTYAINRTPFDECRKIATADVNGDGLVDMVVAKEGVDTAVLLGTGKGAFAAPAYYPTGDYPESVAIADFDGDGALDFVTQNVVSNSLSFSFGNGDGTFGNEVDVSYAASTNESASALAVSDYDHDGLPDVALASQNANLIEVVTHTAARAFAAAVTISLPNVTGMVSADFDGDGVADLAATVAASGTVDVYKGSCQ